MANVDTANATQLFQMMLKSKKQHDRAFARGMMAAAQLLNHTALWKQWTKEQAEQIANEFAERRDAHIAPPED